MEIAGFIIGTIGVITSIIFGVITLRTKKEVRDLRLLINGDVKIKNQANKISNTGANSINIGGDMSGSIEHGVNNEE